MKLCLVGTLALGAVFICTAQTSGAGPASWVGDLSPIGASDWNYDRAAHLLERAGFTVVEQCANGEELLTAVRAQLPDLAIIDIRLRVRRMMVEVR